ncbi:MAG: hypothetical protein RR370_02675 [Synergistaceae bacterium]
MVSKLAEFIKKYNPDAYIEFLLLERPVRSNNKSLSVAKRICEINKLLYGWRKKGGINMGYIYEQSDFRMDGRRINGNLCLPSVEKISTQIKGLIQKTDSNEMVDFLIEAYKRAKAIEENENLKKADNRI